MRAGRMRGHPGFRVLHDFHAAPLYSSPARFSRRMLGKIVIEIESAIQTRRQSFAIENDRANERRSAVAVLL